MKKQEAQLNPEAEAALRLIRALRALPETSGTVAAEKRALNSLCLTDLSAVARILQQDGEEMETSRE